MQELPQVVLSRIAAGGGDGGLFGFSVWGLIAGIVFSAIGYFYFRAGKRESDFITLGTGIALMGFPCFVTNALHIVLVGTGIMALHYFSGKSQ